MPIVTPNKEIEVSRTVRDAFVLDPLIGTRRMTALLEQRFNRSFDRAYVIKLMKKVHLIVRHEVSTADATDRIGQFRENARIALENLRKIAHGQVDAGKPAPSYKDQIAAWRAMAMIDKMVLEAEFDAGIFERKLGTVDVEHHHTIDLDRAAKMIGAIKMWTITPPQPRRIEAREVFSGQTDNVPSYPLGKPPERKQSPFVPRPMPTDQGPVIPGPNGSATIIPTPVKQPMISIGQNGNVVITPAK